MKYYKSTFHMKNLYLLWIQLKCHESLGVSSVKITKLNNNRKKSAIKQKVLQIIENVQVKLQKSFNVSKESEANVQLSILERDYLSLIGDLKQKSNII